MMLPNIELRSLRAFLAVVRHGSFNRAAAAMDIGQPAISKNIAALERAYRTSFFKRGPHGSALSPTGMVMDRVSASVLKLLEDAAVEIDQLNGGSSGRLVIGATPSTAVKLVPLTCARLCERMKADITIREGLDIDLMIALERHEIDILIGPASDIHPPPPPIHEEVLAEEGFAIGMRRMHPLATCTNLELTEAARQPWVMPGPGSRFHRLVEAMFQSSALAWPSDVITTNSLAAQDAIVLESDRLLISTDVQRIGNNEKLLFIPLVNSPRRRLGWRMLKGVQPSPLVCEFVMEITAVTRSALSLSHDSER